MSVIKTKGFRQYSLGFVIKKWLSLVLFYFKKNLENNVHTPLGEKCRTVKE